MKLSPAELNVLTLVALGYSDKEIGTKTKISYGTVRSHIDKLVLKLNARNRTHAAIVYMSKHPGWLNNFL